MKSCLIRTPSRELARGIVTWKEKSPVDVDLALRQWDDYVDVLTSSGWNPILMPAAEDCPDSVFVEDVVVSFDGVAVVTRPAVASRRPEIHGVAEFLDSLGLEVHSIAEPGLLEGGDVLRVGDTLYVGIGGRSNVDGARQLREILSKKGARVIEVPMGPVLHLKSALTALPNGSFIGYPSVLREASLFPGLTPVAELGGSNVVVLGDNHVLLPANCPATLAQVTGMGVDVTSLDVSEFQKLEGDVTCLCVLIGEL
jgi:dimethylargininase